MRKRKILLVCILVWAFLVGIIFFPKQNSNQKPGSVIKSDGYSKETKMVKNSLLHWSSIISPNGLYRGDSYTGDYADYYNYYQLFVTNRSNGKAKKVYRGDFRTMGWEWTDDSRIKITYNCGTGCSATRIVGADETARVNDSESGLISKENGWKLKFFRSF